MEINNNNYDNYDNINNINGVNKFIDIKSLFQSRNLKWVILFIMLVIIAYLNSMTKIKVYTANIQKGGAIEEFISAGQFIEQLLK